MRLELVTHDIYAERLQPDFGHVLLMEATSTMILIELARYVRQLDRQSSKHGASRISPI